MKLDLSYNRLTSLEKAHYRLGNIQTLLLSHNQLTSVRGLDRLLALETLWLDHNQLANLTDVSGLAGLPELKELRLEGNPLQLVNKKAFRVDVLNLFKERRLSSLPSGATYGDLQRILPILDGWQASLKELKALRQRTFVVADVHVRLSRDGPLLQQEGTGVLPNQSIDASATPKAPSVCSGSSRSQRRRRKMAVIGESAEATEGNGATGKRSLGRNDRIPEVGFTVDDVLRSLSETVELAEDEEREETDQGQEQEELDAKQREAKAGNIGIKYLESASFFVAAETEVKKEAQPSSVSKLNGAPSQATTEAATDFPTEKEENASSTEIATPLRRAVEEESDELVSIRQIDMPVAGAELGNLSLSMINTEDDSPELKASAATTATTAETHADESPGEVSSPTNVPVTPTSSKKTAVGLGLERQPLTPFSSGSSVQATPPDHVRLNIRATSIPGSLFQEDNESTTSSLMATEIRDNTSLTKLFLRAEASSTYDGPLSSYKLRICDNIELYFRLFVFAPHEADSSVGDWIEGYEWRHALQHYPRIQLWPVDRRVREFVQADQSLFKLEESREEFRRVWREKVVPCGKPALRRLTPNRDVRFGFHGELLWSAADSSQLKPETVVECREAIVCLSTTAFYIIADHDKVTEKLQDQKRKFPVPIPKDATFKDAKWPHALARHPFACLEGITIGFGFQRLTLHFSVDPNKVGYTYILLTSNKMQTVALLREIQEMVREAAGPKEHSITIENDDRHVLDALGVAVAPDVVDVVQHYQILQQQWKHGDRGAVRRVCVVTDDKLFLLDEDYAGDGSESMEVGAHKQLGESTYRLVDSAALEQITEIKAADANPTTITISFKSNSYLRRRTHNWRLVCRDGQGAERLVEDVRKAMSFAAHGKANPFAL
jgi:Leucine-rich repeat (LRR) protein